MPDSLPSIEIVGRFFGQFPFFCMCVVDDKIHSNLGHRWYSEIQFLNFR